MNKVRLAIALFCSVTFGAAAFAAGEGGGGTGSGGGGTGSGGGGTGSSSSGGSSSGGSGGQGYDPSKKCSTGEVWNLKKHKCVKASAGVLPDDELYQQGRALAKSGHYEWALQVLSVISNQNNPYVLNYEGYSHRKAGRLETGITYYRKALAINPDFVLAREYLGEGYVAAGRIDLARVELGEIANRCGKTCEEFKDLNAAINSATN